MRAKLMPKYLKQRFAEIGSQDWRALPDDAFGVPIEISERFPDGTIIVAKYFHPWSSWTWYATECDEENQRWFGFVDGTYGEWGYFSMAEFNNISQESPGPMMLPIERDTSFRECRFKDIRPQLIGEGIYRGT